MAEVAQSLLELDDLVGPAAEDGSFQWLKHFDVVLLVRSVACE